MALNCSRHAFCRHVSFNNKKYRSYLYILSYQIGQSWEQNYVLPVLCNTLYVPILDKLFAGVDCTESQSGVRHLDAAPSMVCWEGAHLAGKFREPPSQLLCAAHLGCATVGVVSLVFMVPLGRCNHLGRVRRHSCYF